MSPAAKVTAALKKDLKKVLKKGPKKAPKKATRSRFSFIHDMVCVSFF
jgi:uncharacterized protein (DUF2267 family)